MFFLTDVLPFTITACLHMETGAVLLCYIAMLVYHLFEQNRVRIARERIGNSTQRLKTVQLLLTEGRVCA